MPAEHDIDLIIYNEFFWDKSPGVLIEIGAGKPDFLSIGNLFRKKGWRVISIEPNPTFAALHRELGHEIYEYACATEDKDEVDFVIADAILDLHYCGGQISAESFSSLSLRDKYLEMFLPMSDKFSLRNIKVKTRRLDTIISYLKDITKIDVVVIDVEGWELECLKSFSFGKLTPKLIICENLFNNPDYLEFMKNKGYHFWRAIPPNEVYLLESFSKALEIEKQNRNTVMTSYSSNFEDVLLRRCFQYIKNGFYVDIGAHHPTYSSVTRWFYDQGWSGINIEPGDEIQALKKERPRDINLNVAVSDYEGETTFWMHTGNSGTSTLFKEVPFIVSNKAGEIKPKKVQVTSLNSILDNYISNQPIHFLKIDAEGAENAIILSTDWKKYRPEVLVIESTEPYTNKRRKEAWQNKLEENDYQMVYFDGVNDFWIRKESIYLMENFVIPVNVLDYFQCYDPKVEALKAEAEFLKTELTTLRAAYDNLQKTFLLKMFYKFKNFFALFAKFKQFQSPAKEK